MQEQAIHDAEREMLEKESEQLQQLAQQLDEELAAVQKRTASSSNASSSTNDSPAPSLPTQSSGETSQASLLSSTTPCHLNSAVQQHRTMYEAYEYLVRGLKVNLLHMLFHKQ